MAKLSAKTILFLPFFSINIFPYEIVDYSFDAFGGEQMYSGEYAVRGAGAQMVASGTKSFGGEYVSREGFYNPAFFAYQKKLPINFSNNSISFYLPEESVNKETFDLFYNENLSEIPEKEKILNANSVSYSNYGEYSVPVKIGKLDFMDEESFYNSAFSKEGRMYYKISDSDLDGNIDGTNPPVRIKTLNSHLLDKEYSIWLKTFSNSTDINNGYVSFVFNRSGVYSLFGQIDDAVKDVYAFPVPFRPNGPNRGIGIGKTGTEEDGITFINIPQYGKIEIYTIDARLVKEIIIPSGLTESKIKWDVKNSYGEKVASGVYIWRVVSGKNTKTGKLVVIR